MSQENFVIEELVKELVLRLIDEKHLSMRDALDAVYNSETYTKILDTRTGLYSQSTAYVYDYLDNELTSGKLQ